jgi:ABC-type transport system involved in cytochrome bd biosynthesis fused ATPase/permease subunit
MTQKSSAVLTLSGGVLFIAAAAITALDGHMNYAFLVVGIAVMILGLMRLRNARENG